MLERKLSRQRPLDATENRRQISRFLVVGCSSAAADLACYLLLTSQLGVVRQAAKGASYLAGMVVGFFGNKYWTFGSARRTLAEPVTYLVLYAATLLMNVGIHTALLKGLDGRFGFLAFLGATGATTMLNFLGMRLVAFRAGIRERQRLALGPSSGVQQST